MGVETAGELAGWRGAGRDGDGRRTEIETRGRRGGGAESKLRHGGLGGRRTIERA